MPLKRFLLSGNFETALKRVPLHYYILEDPLYSIKKSVAKKVTCDTFMTLKSVNVMTDYLLTRSHLVCGQTNIYS